VFLRGTTHTGFVSAVRGNVFETIEGNTNIGGSPEGFGVFRRTRPITRDYQFVRWGRLLEDEPESTYALFIGGKHFVDMPVPNGRALCPIRRWGEAMGFKVRWDNEAQAPTFNGKKVATKAVLIDEVGYAPVRDLADAAGLVLTVDAPARRVSVSRPRPVGSVMAARSRGRAKATARKATGAGTASRAGRTGASGRAASKPRNWVRKRSVERESGGLRALGRAYNEREARFVRPVGVTAAPCDKRLQGEGVSCIPIGSRSRRCSSRCH